MIMTIQIMKRVLDVVFLVAVTMYVKRKLFQCFADGLVDNKNRESPFDNTFDGKNSSQYDQIISLTILL